MESANTKLQVELKSLKEQKNKNETQLREEVLNLLTTIKIKTAKI